MDIQIFLGRFIKFYGILYTIAKIFPMSDIMMTHPVLVWIIMRVESVMLNDTAQYVGFSALMMSLNDFSYCRFWNVMIEAISFIRHI